MPRKSKAKNIRDDLQNLFPDVDLLFMEEKEYDEAIVGVIDGKAHEPAICYDYDKVIEINVKDGMNYEDAVEFWNYNQRDAYVGKNTPVFLFKNV
jgi:hypothetical protein